MDRPTGNATRRPGRGIRPLLLLLKLLGLTGFLGGMASITAMGLLGPRPETIEGWRTLRAAMRGIFYPCFFGGIVVAFLAGIALYLQHPAVFRRLRWFRVKAGLLIVATPVLHLWARGRVLAFDRALDVERLDELPPRWEAVTLSFGVGLLVFLGIAAIGRIKPRLGEAPGSRAMPRG